MRGPFSTIVDIDEPTLAPTAAAPRSDAEPTLPGRSSVVEDPRLEDMRARLAEKDYPAALALADSVLAEDAENLEARECKLRSEIVLADVCLALLGPLSQVPEVAVSAEEVCELSLDNRLGFVLSRIDGVTTLETILAISGMAQLEALYILLDLVKRRVVILL